jgi:hypothetical protein
MHILQIVSVVQVVTEKLKQNRVSVYEQQKRRLERETAQLLFEKKKAERGGSKQAEAAARFQIEIDQRHEKISILEFQISQLDQLPLGTELKEREIQSIIELKTGDRFDGKNGGTIVVKDGIIIEIRTEE